METKMWTVDKIVDKEDGYPQLMDVSPKIESRRADCFSD